MEIKNKSKNILFILESFYPNVGGVEYLFKLLTEKLAHIHNITVITAKSTRSLKINSNEQVNSSIKIITVPVRSRYLFTFLAFFYALKVAGKQDLIHTTSYNAALPAFLIAKLFRKKIVITFHEYWGNLWFKLPYLNPILKRLFYYFEKLIVNLNFDKFVAVSEATKDALVNAGIKESRIERIYNGIDYQQFKINPAQREKLRNKNKYMFLFYGRAGVSKGLDVLIKAAKLTNDLIKNKNWQLIIQSSDVRQFSVLDKLEREVETGKLQDKVIFQKERLSEQQLKHLISSVNCVIVPSYTEGFCFSALEACALQVPVIHSGRGSLPEVVSGSFLEFQNMRPEDLTEKMELAMQAKFEQKPLKKFEIEDSVSRYIDLYNNLSI